MGVEGGGNCSFSWVAQVFSQSVRRKETSRIIVGSWPVKDRSEVRTTSLSPTEQFLLRFRAHIMITGSVP